jgi:hypothetical protein
MSSTCWRAERRAVPRRGLQATTLREASLCSHAHPLLHPQPQPAPVPSEAEPGRTQSSELFAPGEGLGLLAQRGLQDRPMYPLDEGQT